MFTLNRFASAGVPMRVIGLLLTLVFFAGLLAVAPAKADIGAVPDLLANLENVATGRCADLPGAEQVRQDTRVTQSECRDGSGDNQRWHLERHGEAPDGRSTFLIKNEKGGCMDLPNYGVVVAGTYVSLYSCRPEGDNQLFLLVPSDEAAVYQLAHAVDPRLCLDVAGIRSVADEARLTLWNCSQDDDHLWRLRTAPGEDLETPGINSFRVDTSPDVLLRVRSAPSVDSEVIHKLNSGAPLDATCVERGPDGRRWLKIRLGFVAAEFVRGNSSLLPGCRGDEIASSLVSPSEATYDHAVDYITDEMVRNTAAASEAVARCRLAVLHDVECRALYWLYKVRPGGEWDHKETIKDWFCYGPEDKRKCAIRSSDRYFPVPLTEYAVNFDIWSNIHYGYVGRVLGFSPSELQKGADITEGIAGRNDDGDRKAIDIGIDLHSRAMGGRLTTVQVDDAVRAQLGELARVGGQAAVLGCFRHTMVSPCEARRDLDDLLPGERLDPYDYPYLEGPRSASEDSLVRLVMQQDGNLVLYGLSVGEWKPCWASNTVGRGAYAVYHGDGNLVVYEGDEKVAWASDTKGRDAGKVEIDADSFLRIGGMKFKDGASDVSCKVLRE